MNENWQARAEAAEQELERVRKACAAKHQALLDAKDWLWNYEAKLERLKVIRIENSWEYELQSRVNDIIQSAISTNAGSDYHHRDEYKPLVERCKILCDRAPHIDYPREWRSDPIYKTHVPYCELLSLKEALSEARAKGLIS